MKKSAKALLISLCAVLLVVASVMGTLAYLTSTATVTNTFSVGSVAITMDETDVTVYGLKDTDTRVQTNEYKLVPGHEYIKDPVIHVAAGSEECYLFVKVENGIAGIEAAGENGTIETQITNNGWTAMDGGVYYKSQAATTEAVDVPVFAEFAVSGTVDSDTLASYSDATIVVTAYAVQADGFTDAAAAWAATFGAQNG